MSNHRARGMRVTPAVTRLRVKDSGPPCDKWETDGDDSALHGAVPDRRGRTPALARRLRPAARPGRKPRPPRPRRGRSLAHPPSRRALDRPSSPRRQGAPARARRRLRPRPPLVARPDGADAPAARRADDARLARLVRHLELGCRLAEADARPEPAPAALRARQLRPAARLDHREPGDAHLALRAPTTARTRRTRTTAAS